MDFNTSALASDNTLGALPLVSQLQQQYQQLVESYEQNKASSSSAATISAEHPFSILSRPEGTASNIDNPFQHPGATAASNNSNRSSNNNNYFSLPSSFFAHPSVIMSAVGCSELNNSDNNNNVNNDGGDDDVDGELGRDGQHHPIAEFLYQLTKMLSDDNSEIIEWADGRIKVHYPERLEAEVLHKYFRHSKFASFQRQLNYFGFRKIAGKGKMSPCSYVNDAATSDIRSLLLIKRKTNGSAARKAAMQQRAAAFATSSLNPLLQFPGAAAALAAGNPAALASLTNPQALSGAMALLSDNAFRAGLLAQQQQAGVYSGAVGNSPQLNLLLQQQQQFQQQMNPLFSGLGGVNIKADNASSMGAFPAPTPPTQPSPSPSSAALLHVDHNQIAQQTQQLQLLQQQLQLLQQQQKLQQHKLQQQQQEQQQRATATSSFGGGSQQQSPQFQGSFSAAFLSDPTSLAGASNNSIFSSLTKEAFSAASEPALAAVKPPSTISAQQQAFDQLWAARFAAASSNTPGPASVAAAASALGSLGAASAALKQLQAGGGGSDNPASAALQQQFSSMPASAAIDAVDPSQASNNLFESALNLKSLLQEHQASATVQENSQAAPATRGLMHRLPSSNTIFPSIASFGNLLNSSNRLSSLLSLSSFVGGPGCANAAGAPVSSREPSLADLAAAINPGSMGGSAPLSAAALAAFQQRTGPASAAAAHQFKTM